MKATILKTKKYIETLMLLIAAGIMTFFVSPVYCDKLEDASKQAAEGIQVSVQGAVKWLLVIVMVVGGLIFIIGTSRQRETAKERAPGILLGVGMIVCAVPLAAIIFGWF